MRLLFLFSKELRRCLNEMKPNCDEKSLSGTKLKELEKGGE